ncbi:MAG: hypothetical protein CL878_02500 [Dehalococcoidia bacterium]|nr:hypothetical protein [Dehalococcoidia bacterium]
MNDTYDVALRGLSSGMAGVAILTMLGIVPTHLLLRGALRRAFWLVAPLVGWAVLVVTAYALLPVLNLRLTLVVIVGAGLLTTVAWGLWRAAHWWTRQREHQPTGIAVAAVVAVPRPDVVTVAVAALALGLFVLALAPHIRHGSPLLLIPNGDEEYYVERQLRMLSSPVGWRVTPHSLHETMGWAYHLLMGLLTVATGAHSYHAFLLAGYVSLALSIPAVYLFAVQVGGLRRWWALVAAALAAAHGLPLWVASYGSGPNAAATAAVPFGLALFHYALRSRYSRAILLGGLGVTLATVSFYRVTALLAAQVGTLVAAAVLLGATGQDRGRLARRLASLAGLMFVLGWLTHYPALLFAWRRLGPLLWGDELTQGTGWGLTVVPPWQLVLGTELWGFIQLPATPSLPAVLSGLATALVVLAAAYGLWRLGRRDIYIVAVVAAYGTYWLYARFIKAFPYAEFKVFSVGYFLAPVLVIAGLLGVVTALRRTRVAVAAGVGVVAIYGVTLGWSTLASVRFSWDGWGWTVRPALLQEIDSVVQAIPGNEPVWVSGGFQWAVPASEVVVREHPVGLHTPWHQLNFLRARVLGMLVLALREAGRDVYGLIEGTDGQRAGWREDGRYRWLVLGAREEPRLWGADPGDLVLRGEHWYVYHRPERPRLDASELARSVVQPDLEQVRASLAAGCDSLSAAPPLASTAPHRPGENGCLGRIRLGLLAGGEGVVRLDGLPASAQAEKDRERDQPRQIYVTRGLSWYTTEALPLPRTLTISGHPDLPLRLVAAELLTDDLAARPSEVALDDQLETGTVPVLHGVAVPDGRQLRLDFWYINPRGVEPQGPRPIRASLGSSPKPVSDGVWWPGELDVRAPFERWSWYLDGTGQPVRQEVNGQTRGVPYEPTWPLPDSPPNEWLFFRLGRGWDEWLRRPLFLATRQDGVIRRVLPQTVLQTVELPPTALPAPVIPAEPILQNDALVKGATEHVFFVREGVRHWIPDLDTFSRWRFEWGQVQQVSPELLTQLPVGLPLR